MDDRKREFNALTEADKQTFAALPDTVESWDSLGNDARTFKKFYMMESIGKWRKIDFSTIRFSTTMGGGARKTKRKMRKQRKQRKSRRTRRH